MSPLIHPQTKEIQWHQLLKLLEPIAKEERQLLIQDNNAFRKLPNKFYQNASSAGEPKPKTSKSHGTKWTSQNGMTRKKPCKKALKHKNES
jgi:hypothetical protein